MYKRIPGRALTVGHSITHALPIKLDPGAYKGAQIFAGSHMYWSNGFVWNKMMEEAVDQPTALVPVTARQKRQMRLSPFNSEAGYTHTGTLFEISATNDFTDPTLINVATPVELYELGPEDGLAYGDEFWWRAAYQSSGPRSEFSLPFKQTYPQPVEVPALITASGTTTNTLQYQSFDSAFEYTFNRAEVQVFDSPLALGTPILDIANDTSNNGETPVSTIPGEDGTFFYWRVRYVGANPENTADLYVTPWSLVRSYLQVPSTLKLEINTALGETRSLFLPLGGDVDVAVDWGDGTPLEYFTTPGDKQHTYSADGTYLVEISGTLTEYGSATVPDNSQAKIIRVLAMSEVMGLGFMRYAFRNCVNLTSVPNYLPASVLHVDEMFEGCTNFNGNISEWDVSNVIGFGRMLWNCVSFNRPLNSWRFNTSVNSLSEMFYGCTSFNQPLDQWNVGNISDFSGLFFGCTEFNQPLDSWQPAALTTIENLFYGCDKFNQPIDSWGLHFGNGILNAERAFREARAFNQPLTNWNLNNCRTFFEMFAGARAFNQPLDHWQFSLVNSVNIKGMFKDAWAFNQNLDSWGSRLGMVSDVNELFYLAKAFNNGAEPGTSGTAPGINDWDVSTITDFYMTFRAAEGFNQPLDKWNMSNAWDLAYMFDGATSFNQSLSGWERDTPGDVSTLANVEYFSLLFNGCTAFNNGGDPGIDNWNVSGGITFQQIFHSCPKFNQPVGSWRFSTDPTVEINCHSMFAYATLFNQPIGGWNMTRVTTIQSMFFEAFSFNQDISTWERDTPGDESTLINNTSMSTVFYRAYEFGYNATWSIGNWRTDNVENFSYCFYQAGRGIDLAFDRSFNQDISGWNVSNGKSFRRMFYYCRMFNQDLSSWFQGENAAEDITNMFFGATNFNNGGSDGIRHWNVGHITSFDGLFFDARVFNQPIGDWDVSSCEDMTWMLYNAHSFNQDLSGWERSTPGNVSTMANVVKINETFKDARAFNNGGSAGINNWSMGAVTEATETFSDTQTFNQPIDGWALAPTRMDRCFDNASAFNQPLPSWNVSNVVDMTSVFEDAVAFDQSLAAWDVSSVQTLYGFLSGGELSTANFDATLIAWSQLPNLETGVNFDAGSSTYSNTTTVNDALDILINTKGWTITSGGPAA